MIDVGRSHPPMTIPPGARAALTAIPSNSLTRDGEVRDFVSPNEDPSRLEGSTVQLLIPLRIQDVTNEYTFLFELREVALVTEIVRCAAACTEADVARARLMHRARKGTFAAELPVGVVACLTLEALESMVAAMESQPTPRLHQDCARSRQIFNVRARPMTGGFAIVDGGGLQGTFWVRLSDIRRK
jgi:hypothetical protein